MQWMLECFICNGSAAKDWGLSTQEMGWIGSINSIGMAVGALVLEYYQIK